MVRYCRSPWIAVPVALMLAAIVPMLVGQGCPQGPWAEPLDPGLLPTGQTVVTVIAEDRCGNVSDDQISVTVVSFKEYLERMYLEAASAATGSQ